ncbi:putative sugar-terminal-phosphatase [Helianthus annuus]|nr:putative sugar-terminal-phosphatase [Helianthus annuus]
MPHEISEKRKSAFTALVPLEAVLFDIDGTLCDSDPIHFVVLRELLQETGFNGGIPIDEDFFAQNISGKLDDDIAAVLFPNDIERGLKLCEEKEERFRKLVKEKAVPIKGLYKLTKWVEDHGLKRAAVTNSPRPNAELMISTLGLTDFFHHNIIIGDECEHAKPAPDPYLNALKLLNVSKDHTFICEDSVSGIKAGVAAGMPVIGLTTRNPKHMLMKANPTLLIENYEDPKLWEVLGELNKRENEA